MFFNLVLYLNFNVAITDYIGMSFYLMLTNTEERGILLAIVLFFSTKPKLNSADFVSGVKTHSFWLLL